MYKGIGGKRYKAKHFFFFKLRHQIYQSHNTRSHFHPLTPKTKKNNQNPKIIAIYNTTSIKIHDYYVLRCHQLNLSTQNGRTIEFGSLGFYWHGYEVC